jgi:hypothetical protein
MASLTAAGAGEAQVSECRMALQQEIDILDRQKEENIRRRHNYIPFVVSLCRALAGKRSSTTGSSALTDMVDAAAAKHSRN